MKRYIIYLGRGGTGLATIGFILLLFSITYQDPSMDTYGTFSIPSKMVDSLHSFPNVTVTPHQSFRVTATANGTLIIYILEIHTQTVVDWIVEHKLQPTSDYFLNVTNLEAFLEANPYSIVWYGGTHNGRTEYKYAPMKATNVTLLFSNPSSDHITVDFEGSITTIVGIGSKSQTLGLWVFSIGIILTLPWLAQLWIEKPSQQSNNRNARARC